MTNQRKIGDKLEKRVQTFLSKDLGFEQTANSGAKWQDGDLRHTRYVVEIKVKNNTGGASIAQKDLSKLKRESTKQGKEWIYVCENVNGDLVAMLPLATLSELIHDSQEFHKPYE